MNWITLRISTISLAASFISLGATGLLGALPGLEPPVYIQEDPQVYALWENCVRQVEAFPAEKPPVSRDYQLDLSIDQKPWNSLSIQEQGQYEEVIQMILYVLLDQAQKGKEDNRIYPFLNALIQMRFQPEFYSECLQFLATSFGETNQKVFQILVDGLLTPSLEEPAYLSDYLTHRKEYWG